MTLEQISEYRAVDEVSQWTIRDGERIVGGCTVVIYRHVTYNHQAGAFTVEKRALITGVHLEPEYRGRGLIDCLRPLLRKYPQISGATFFRKYDSNARRRERRGVLGLRAHCAGKPPQMS